MTLAPYVLLALAQTAPTISAETKRQTIDALFSEMRSDYVFAEVATRAEAQIRQKWSAGQYDRITGGEQFAGQLTRDLYDTCRDVHLQVRYSATPLPERHAPSQPSAEETAAVRLRAKKANGGFRRTEILSGNVGYIRFDDFADPDLAGEPLRAAMEFVANTDALIFDVLSNSGGSPVTGQLVCSYLFDQPTHLTDLYWRRANKTTKFWTLREVPGKRYLGRDVFILVGKKTFSAAEEFSYNLKHLKRAILVGEWTSGGAHVGGTARLNDHFSAFIPRARSINPITMTNWEGTGVMPDVKVPAAEALPTAHRAAIKRLLKKTTDSNTRAELERTLKELPAGSPLR